VIQSGFEMEIKRHWLGQKWYLPGAAGNDINKACSPLLRTHLFVLTNVKTNVPNIRLAFRHQTLMEEFKMIWSGEQTDPDNLDGSNVGK
jgi:AMP deaminase